jgi:transposase-like protein
MPGHPLKSRLNADIEALGGLPWVLAQIASGVTINAMARQFDCSRWLLDRWIWMHTKGTTLVQDARRRGATALAEQTVDIADNATMADERVARLQIDSRKWLASKLSPGEYGEQKAAVNINIGDMHLLALKHVEQNAPSGLQEAHKTLALPAGGQTPTAAAEWDWDGGTLPADVAVAQVALSAKNSTGALGAAGRRSDAPVHEPVGCKKKATPPPEPDPSTLGDLDSLLDSVVLDCL